LGSWIQQPQLSSFGSANAVYGALGLVLPVLVIALCGCQVDHPVGVAGCAKSGQHNPCEDG